MTQANDARGDRKYGWWLAASSLLAAIAVVWVFAGTGHIPLSSSPGRNGSLPKAEGENGSLAQSLSNRVTVNTPQADAAASMVDRRLVVTFLWESDLMPAAGIEATMIQEAPDTFTRPLRLRSRGDGTISFGGLKGGSVKLATDRCGVVSIEIADGELTEETVIVPDLPRIVGRVVDRQGNGVAGAEIWLSEGVVAGGAVSTPERLNGTSLRANISSRFWAVRMEDGKTAFGAAPSELLLLSGSVVTHSQHDGSFRIRGAQPGRFIWARHEIWTPSRVERCVRWSDEENKEITLVMGDPGWSIEGEVVDELGIPFEGAFIQIGSPADGIWRVEDGSWVPGPRPIVLWTDKTGRFRSTSLPVERVHLVCIAPECAPVLKILEPDPTGLASVMIEIRRGVTVTGTVVDSSGQHVADVPVEALSLGFNGVPTSHVRSDTNGRFCFTGLAASGIALRADGGTRGIGGLSLQPAAGESLECTIHLEPGLRLAVRVTDDEGAPLSGAYVYIAPDGGMPIDWYRMPDPADNAKYLTFGEARTNGDGEVIFYSCYDIPYEVTIRDVPRDAPWMLAMLGGIEPGGPQVHVVVPRSAFASCVVCGIVGVQSPVESEQLIVRLQVQPGSCTAKTRLRQYPAWSLDARLDADGKFQFGPVPQGVYTLNVLNQQQILAQIEQVEVLGGVKVCDVGFVSIE